MLWRIGRVKQIKIILALIPLLLVGLITLEKCDAFLPVEPTVMRGPHGLEIRSRAMGALIRSPPCKPVATVG